MSLLELLTELGTSGQQQHWMSVTLHGRDIHVTFKSNKEGQDLKMFEKGLES